MAVRLGAILLTKARCWKTFWCLKVRSTTLSDKLVRILRLADHRIDAGGGRKFGRTLFRVENFITPNFLDVCNCRWRCRLKNGWTLIAVEVFTRQDRGNGFRDRKFGRKTRPSFRPWLFYIRFTEKGRKTFRRLLQIEVFFRRFWNERRRRKFWALAFVRIFPFEESAAGKFSARFTFSDGTCVEGSTLVRARFWDY